MWKRKFCHLLAPLLGLEIPRITASGSEFLVLFHGWCLLCAHSGILVVPSLVFSFWLLFFCEVKPSAFPSCHPVCQQGKFSSLSYTKKTQKKRCCSSSERSKLCVPNLPWNFCREVEMAEWKPGQAERSQLLQSHLPQDPHWGHLWVSLLGILKIGMEIEL